MRKQGSSGECEQIVRRHLAIGWWGLAVYIALGLALETMHGFKMDFYLDVRNETRRLMWTLSHTHGTLLSLVNIAWAVSLNMVSASRARRPDSPAALISWGLTAGWLLLPVGFFLGGLWVYGGDPSRAILLVPIGALLLLAAVLTAARYVTRQLGVEGTVSEPETGKRSPKKRKQRRTSE